MRTLFLVLIPALLLTGCFSASTLPEPLTATPEIMPRLDPSPTSSGSTLPLTCQVTDLKVYVNEADGYCFAYPARFKAGQQPMLNVPAIVGPALEDVDPVFAAFSVEVAAAADRSLREQAEPFLKEFSAVDSASFTWTQVPVGGEAGLMVEPVPVMLSYRIVFVQHNGQIFRLSYWPVDVEEAKADLDELTQTTLGSFAFTK